MAMVSSYFSLFSFMEPVTQIMLQIYVRDCHMDCNITGWMSLPSPPGFEPMCVAMWGQHK